LIVNADDLGMCHAVNEATFRVLKGGIACSTSLLIPSPGALHAMHFLAEHPEMPSGVHLTAIPDSTKMCRANWQFAQPPPRIVERIRKVRSWEKTRWAYNL
jgi:predicted glycoside hydrolase/deacetylase ChbG (UPF0249 family)